jgi:predicted phosphodiesterase
MTRVFAISDIHLDYKVNVQWLSGLSIVDYQDDILILAGDVSDSSNLLQFCFETLSRRFKHVLFVPGNHDLWVFRYQKGMSSLEKFDLILTLAKNHGILMHTLDTDGLTIIPMYSWYDYSFGLPNNELKNAWMDYHACVWPPAFDQAAITRYFLKLNTTLLPPKNKMVITFSHFLPRIDVMPNFIPPSKRFVYPVLGTNLLEPQIRALQSKIHIYGHSHVNRRIEIDGIFYVNNAFGYPSETRITGKELICIFEN